MADEQAAQDFEVLGLEVLECGGLSFEVTFRDPGGATLRVSGDVGGQVTELVRFDDFVDAPHYHIPASADPFPFDRAAHGEPLSWFITQLRDHLGEMLTEAGYAELLPDLDVAAIAALAGQVQRAMETCVPDGYQRVPGVGLQRIPA